jgi:hypothetical protein
LLGIKLSGDSARYYNSLTRVKQITTPHQKMDLVFPLSLSKGKYSAKLCIASNIPISPTLNSTNFNIEIK